MHYYECVITNVKCAISRTMCDVELFNDEQIVSVSYLDYLISVNLNRSNIYFYLVKTNLVNVRLVETGCRHIGCPHPALFESFTVVLLIRCP